MLATREMIGLKDQQTNSCKTASVSGLDCSIPLSTHGLLNQNSTKRSADLTRTKPLSVRSNERSIVAKTEEKTE